jgi:hypothetical protein
MPRLKEISANLLGDGFPAWRSFTYLNTASAFLAGAVI